MPDGLMEIALIVFSVLSSLCFLDMCAFLETSHLHSGREGGRSVLWVCVSACVSFQGVLVPRLCVCVCVCVCVCSRGDQHHITGRYISAFQKVDEPNVGFPGEEAIRALWFIGG